eukprot:189321_1
MNLNTAFNLVNIVSNYPHQSHQQNRSPQQFNNQNIQPLPTIRARGQQTIPYTQLQNNTNQYQSNQHNLPYKSEHSNNTTTLPSASITNQYIQLLIQLNQLSDQTNQINQSNRTNINQNYNYSNFTNNNSNQNPQISNPLTTCKSVKECESIRRIVKLGTFQRKLGTSNQNKISEFMNHCPEFQSLNEDYQHSIIFHVSDNDKLAIANLSKEFETIYDLINNVQNINCNQNNNNNNNLQQLIFINNTMAKIYNKQDIKSDIVATNINRIPLPICNYNNNNYNNINISPSLQSLQSLQDMDDTSTHSSNTTPTMHTNNSNNIHVSLNQPPSTIQSEFNVNGNIQTQIRNNININKPQFISISPVKITQRKPIVKPPSYGNTNYNNILLNKNNPFSNSTNNNYIQIQQKFSNAPIGNAKIEPLILNKKLQTNISDNKYNNNNNNNGSGGRRFKCDDCGKTYKHLCNLKSHQKIHTY